MRKTGLIFAFILLILVSCAQSFSGSHSFAKPVLSAVNVNAQGQTQANVESFVNSNGGAEIIGYRILFDDNNPPVDTLLYSPLYNVIISSTPVAIWDAKTGLTPGATYYTKVCVTNIAGETCTSVASITMPVTSNSVPTVTTSAATSVSTTSATINGNVSSDGGATVTERGFYYSLTNPPSTNVTSGSGTGTFNTPLPGLSAAQTYYFRAYATNSVGTSYGDVMTFTLQTPYGNPSVTTTTATNVTINSAVSGGEVLHDGGSAILSRGVCYSTSSSVDTTDSKVITGGAVGVFGVFMPNLTPNTTYYYRAYAYNANGIDYGDEYTFTTLQPYSAPVVSTLEATAITTTTAIAGGNISYNGNSGILESGVCYSTSSNPTTANNKSISGATSVGYYAMLTPLLPSTTYYYRAYAINSIGTGYGSILSFTTEASLSLPTVTVSPISSIGVTVATSGGNVTDDGGSTVTVRGIVWNTSGNPSLLSYDGVTSNGTGEGSFTSSITGLTCSVTYYVRAYATNSIGTAYSDQISFTTTGAALSTISLIWQLTNKKTWAPAWLPLSFNFNSEANLDSACVYISSLYYGGTAADTYEIEGALEQGKQLYLYNSNTTCSFHAYVTDYFIYKVSGYPIKKVVVTNGIITYLEDCYTD